jgi:hypothetical protein
MLLMMLSTQNESPPTISDREQNDPATENPDLAGYKQRLRRTGLRSTVIRF